MNDLVQSEVDRITGGVPEEKGKFTAKRVVTQKSEFQKAVERFTEEDMDQVKLELKQTVKKTRHELYR